MNKHFQSLTYLLLLLFILPSTSFANKVLKAKKGHCEHPKWSHNGRFLSYEVFFPTKRSRLLNIFDTSKKTNKQVRPDVTKNSLDLGVPTETKGEVTTGLAWSPKNNKYIYASNGGGSVTNLYLSGEGKLRINNFRKADGAASWGPKGKYVVFCSGRSGKGDLYWFSLRKMKAKRLTKSSQSTEIFPSFSTVNPRKVAYVRHTDNADKIHIIDNIFTRKSRKLTSLPISILELHPSWSPDGKQIAFYTKTKKNRSDLYVSTLSGKTKKLATNVVKSDQYGPAWSPNGKKIFFVQKYGKEKDKIVAVDVASGATKDIPTGTFGHHGIAITKKAGSWLLAFSAQGKVGGSKVRFRKIFFHKVTPF